MQDMVSELMQNIISRSQKGVSFSEKQTAIFRSLFGNQLAPHLDSSTGADAGDQSRFEQALSPRKDMEVRRETFKVGDAEHNDRTVQEMLGRGGASSHRGPGHSHIGVGLRR